MSSWRTVFQIGFGLLHLQWQQHPLERTWLSSAFGLCAGADLIILFCVLQERKWPEKSLSKTSVYFTASKENLAFNMWMDDLRIVGADLRKTATRHSYDLITVRDGKNSPLKYTSICPLKKGIINIYYKLPAWKCNSLQVNCVPLNECQTDSGKLTVYK